jgi:putative methyltransferase (TIGR04325 family)
MRRVLKKLLPPILIDIYRNFITKRNNLFLGGYVNWNDAASDSSGYSDEKIFSKVLSASLAIKNCHDKYERDSIIFEGNDYPWTILGPLLWFANQNTGRLSVLDYGGSLGNVYFRSLKVLSSISGLNWNVVEQEKYFEAGKKYFETDQLSFYKNLENLCDSQSIDVGLFSSSLQYLNNPYQIIKNLIQLKIKYVILDRTPFYDGKNDKVVVQKVPKDIYLASYPMWIFSKRKFEKFLVENNAVILTKSLGLEGHNSTSDDVNFSFENYLIRLPDCN